MEEVKDYKQEVAQTRTGCLGSSDGKLLAQVCALGSVPKAAFKRLAVCKGLIPQQEIPRTAAIKAGDDIEMAIYQYLSAKDPRYESNPLWVSEKYSGKNVKIISHPDFVLKDEARKILFVYECKATKYDLNTTRQTYKAQLFVHTLLGREIVDSLGDGWQLKVMLVHYNTDGLDLSEGVEFDPARLSVREVRFPEKSPFFDLKKAVKIIDEFLETFTSYYEGDEIDADLLPAKVKDEFELVAATLNEIKEREKTVEEFKKRLYEFMLEKDIKSIKNSVFTISRVDPSESKSFDGKKYVEDMAKEHPRKAKKILAKYTKVIKRKGYASIKVKEEKD